MNGIGLVPTATSGTLNALSNGFSAGVSHSNKVTIAGQIGNPMLANFEQLLNKNAEARAKTPNSDSGGIAKEFDASVLATLLQPIFDNIQHEPPFGGGSQETVMQSFMVQEYAKALADQNNFGFGQAMVEEINRSKSDPDVDANTGTTTKETSVNE